jgi:nitric oxide reductase subunit B
MWFARSPEVIHSSLMETLVWMRVPGDVVFSIGVACLALFAWRLLTRGSRSQVETAAVARSMKA